MLRYIGLYQIQIGGLNFHQISKDGSLSKLTNSSKQMYASNK